VKTEGTKCECRRECNADELSFQTLNAVSSEDRLKENRMKSRVKYSQHQKIRHDLFWDWWCS